MSLFVVGALSRLVLVSLLMVSISLHLVCLQVVAWSGMWVGFVRQGDQVGQAFHKTFDGKHACRLCSFVKSCSQPSSGTDEKLPIQKLELAVDASSFRWERPRLQPSVHPPAYHRWISHSETPPVPPPRWIVA
jgi:hypothetical protein